jgi:hypothetical protein
MAAGPLPPGRRASVPGVVIPVLVLYSWQASNDTVKEPFAQPCSRGTGSTMEPADTCIGRALRGRQAPHALAL